MIEFNGYISGSAEKYFFKKSRILGLKILLCSWILLFPGLICFSLNTELWIVMGIYCSMLLIILLLIYIPKSKKEKRALIPKRIFIEDEYIVAITDKYEDIKQISDVKKVIDYGEFYDLVFPFGKISERFICQKNLLINGSIEDFEAVFRCPIERIVHK